LKLLLVNHLGDLVPAPKNDTLEITSIKPSCPCISVTETDKRVIHEGDTAHLYIGHNAAQRGKFNKKVRIQFKNHPTLSINVSGEVV